MTFCEKDRIGCLILPMHNSVGRQSGRTWNVSIPLRFPLQGRSRVPNPRLSPVLDHSHASNLGLRENFRILPNTPTCRNHVHLFVTRHSPILPLGFGVVGRVRLIVSPLLNTARVLPPEKQEQMKPGANFRVQRDE
jgi:hypothetical protein